MKIRYILITFILISCAQNTKEKNTKTSDIKSTTEFKKAVEFRDTIAVDYHKNKTLLNILKQLPETTLNSWEWSKKDRIKTVDFIKKNNYLIDSTETYNTIKYIKPNTIGIQVVDGFWTLSIYEFNENHHFIITNDIVGDGNDVQTFNFINNEIKPLKMTNWFDGFEYNLLSNNKVDCIKLLEDQQLTYNYNLKDKSSIEISSFSLAKNEAKNCLNGNTIKYKLNKRDKTFDIIDVYWKKDKTIDSLKENETVIFNKIISEIEVKTTPLVEATNFDSFIDEDDYKEVNVKVLKLEKIYPEFYKEGYNYSAIASYKIEYSSNFYSIVVTVLKGDNEMESVLINYDMDGEILDSKVISFDEIAEGYSKIESKIEGNTLTIHNIFWIDEKKVETTSFKIQANGKIEPIPLEETLIDSAMQQLNLDFSKVNTDLLIAKILPNNAKETLIVIPEYVDTDNDEYHFELNSHIVLVDNTTGRITHTYFESSKTNGWVSDAIELRKLEIDTAAYNITKGTPAFGIRVHYVGLSRANPYRNETLSLFIKSGDSLQPVLKNYNIDSEIGHWDTKCTGKYLAYEKTLRMTTNITNNYYDILVKNKIIHTIDDEDKNGDCDSKEKVATEEIVLKFDGSLYQGKNVHLSMESLTNKINSNNDISPQELKLLAKDKAIEKYGTPSSIKQFILDDAQGEFRNGISYKYTEKERQSESILIDEVTWEKDKNTWITVWYEAQKEKSVPKEVYEWKKGSEF
ncbi:PA3715 family protein [Aquimarina rubra]|uniref:PepSY domain-containing protein n=1 Tax=Aquimarina rubra TaxID=1920033 RepID=A0ABW5LDD0_9FLAO